jgi:hypothetical protein
MRLRLCWLLIVGLAFATTVFGQAYEINPYGGYYWHGDNTSVGEFKGNQVLGARGGYFVSSNAELGLNYAWSNRFQPDHENVPAAFAGSLGFPQGSVHSRMWEGEFTYHFTKRNFRGHAVRPYVAVGAGALTARIKDDGQFVLNVRQFVKPCGCIGYTANDVLESGDRFFTFSYGGGVKATRMWGAMGLFADFRGRSIPNFFGDNTNRPELSAGLTFSWGER